MSFALGFIAGGAVCLVLLCIITGEWWEHTLNRALGWFDQR